MYVFSTVRKILKEKWGLGQEFPTSILNQKMELYVHTEYDRHSNNPTTLRNLLRSGSVMCKEHKGSNQLRMIQKLDGPLISGKHMFLRGFAEQRLVSKSMSAAKPRGQKGTWIHLLASRQSLTNTKKEKFLSCAPFFRDWQRKTNQSRALKSESTPSST